MPASGHGIDLVFSCSRDEREGTDDRDGAPRGGRGLNGLPVRMWAGRGRSQIPHHAFWPAFGDSAQCSPRAQLTPALQGAVGTAIGGVFPTLVGRGTVIGAQFHPEKSQQAGIELLAAFVRWKP